MHSPTVVFAPGKNYERGTRTEIAALKRAIKKIDALRKPLLAKNNRESDRDSYRDTREHILEHCAESSLIGALNIGRHDLVEKLERQNANLERCVAHGRTGKHNRGTAG
jgi:hypothetical protein